MILADLLPLLNAQLLTPETDLSRSVPGVGSADLMSDVLACVRAGAVLLTGLCSAQVVRTAHMADLTAIVFVRGKQPAPEVLALATAENIPLLTTPLGMYEACGRLTAQGVPSLETLSLPL